MRSDITIEGISRSPHRGLYYAAGVLPEELGKKPIIGIVNTYNTTMPGHNHLDRLTRMAYWKLAAFPWSFPRLRSATESQPGIMACIIPLQAGN